MIAKLIVDFEMRQEEITKCTRISLISGGRKVMEIDLEFENAIGEGASIIDYFNLDE